MIVQEIMSRKVITISKEARVEKALKLMLDNSVRHLPVVEKKELMGIISDRDLRQSLVPWKKIEGEKKFLYNTNNLLVKDVMTTDLITVSALAPVEEVAKLLLREKIGSVPVEENKKLIGIVTESDLLWVLVEIMGLLKSSSRIDLSLNNDSEDFEKVSRIINKNKGRIISVGISPAKKKNKKIYLFRLESCDVWTLAQKIQKAGYRVLNTIP